MAEPDHQFQEDAVAKPRVYESIIKVVVGDPHKKRAREIAEGIGESDAERKRRIKDRADKARPNVSMTPGQAQTLRFERDMEECRRLCDEFDRAAYQLVRYHGATS